MGKLLSRLASDQRGIIKLSPPHTSALKNTAERMARKYGEPDHLFALSQQELDKAAQGIFQSVPDVKSLKRLTQVMPDSILELDRGEAVLDRIFDLSETGPRWLLRRMLTWYLVLEDLESTVARRLRGIANARLDEFPASWKDAIVRFDLLGPSAGQKLAGQILDSEAIEPSKLAQQSKLTGVRLLGGVGKGVFRSLSENLSVAHTPESLNRYFDYINQTTPPLFRSMAAEHAAALLGPYQSQHADEIIQQRIQSFLIDAYGDPRMSPGTWANVAPEHLAVMRRWLAKSAFRIMMSVISESNDTQHWMDRSKFWSHYLDQGFIQDAWVAFGPDAARIAKRMVRAGQIESKDMFGVLGRGSIEPLHSALIMKIGDFTVTEWSHSGKVRFYLPENRKAPELYQRTYPVTQIRNETDSDLGLIHTPSTWHEKVAGLLKYELGIPEPKQVQPQMRSEKCRSCGQTSHELLFPRGIFQPCNRCVTRR